VSDRLLVSAIEQAVPAEARDEHGIGGVAASVWCNDSPRRPVAKRSNPARCDGPNPIGIHQVVVTGVDGGRMRVRGIEAVDGTPILDLEPVLSHDVVRR
jgi:tRNA (Thr-GGU) A37 N-methylase